MCIAVQMKMLQHVCRFLLFCFFHGLSLTVYSASFVFVIVVIVIVIVVFETLPYRGTILQAPHVPRVMSCGGG